jgi:hypothetical protein
LDSVSLMEWSKAEPILRATYAMMDSNGLATGDGVCTALGIAEDDAGAAFRALEQAGYIDAQFAANGLPSLIEPTEKGLQYCSGWPAPGSSSTFLAEFLSAIEARASDAARPAEERGRLRRFRDAAQDVGQGLLTDIAAKVIEHQTGL